MQKLINIQNIYTNSDRNNGISRLHFSNNKTKYSRLDKKYPESKRREFLILKNGDKS